jgi:hypothetical protein
MQRVVMLNVAMNPFMLSVVMLSVIILNVVAPNPTICLQPIEFENSEL